MFTLQRNPQFTAEVKVLVPSVGEPQEQSFTARFRALSLDELPTLTGSWADDDARSFLHRVLVGWEGIVDDGGKPVPFSDEACDALIATPWAVTPLGRAYFREVYAANRGN